MTDARLAPLNHALLVGLQEEEADNDVVLIALDHAEDIAVLLLQRRAGEDDAVGWRLVDLLQTLVSEHRQPVPPILII